MSRDPDRGYYPAPDWLDVFQAVPILPAFFDWDVIVIPEYISSRRRLVPVVEFRLYVRRNDTPKLFLTFSDRARSFSARAVVSAAYRAALEFNNWVISRTPEQIKAFADKIVPPDPPLTNGVAPESDDIPF